MLCSRTVEDSKEKLILRLVPNDFDPFYVINAWRRSRQERMQFLPEFNEQRLVRLMDRIGWNERWWWARMNGGIERTRSWNFHDHRHTQLKLDTHFLLLRERWFQKNKNPGPVIIIILVSLLQDFLSRLSTFCILPLSAPSVRRCSSSYTAQLTGIIPWIMIDM